MEWGGGLIVQPIVDRLRDYHDAGARRISLRQLNLPSVDRLFIESRLEMFFFKARSCRSGSMVRMVAAAVVMAAVAVVVVAVVVVAVVVVVVGVVAAVELVTMMAAMAAAAAFK